MKTLSRLCSKTAIWALFLQPQRALKLLQAIKNDIERKAQERKIREQRK